MRKSKIEEVKIYKMGEKRKSIFSRLNLECRGKKGFFGSFASKIQELSSWKKAGLGLGGGSGYFGRSDGS